MSNDARKDNTLSLKRLIRGRGMFNHVRWEHFFAGVSGGVVATLTLHPLDLVKIRFQVNEGPGVRAANRPDYKSITHAFHSIFRTEGFAGLYKGVTPNVTGAGLSWGFLTLLLTNPIWVTKTRLCLQYDQMAPNVKDSSSVQYKGMFDALIKIYKMEGIRGLYRFMVYEEMQTFYNRYMNRPIDTRLKSVEYIVFAALSKIVAATVTYPYQVIRSRLQDQHSNYNGILDCIRRIYRFEGFRGFYKGAAVYLIHVTPNVCIVFLMYEGFHGFYKGLAPNLLRVTPACCITFIVYENIISLTLHSDKKKS
ncbi:hypothetical protein KUTeg_000322 [Tegillarca granosa]|uniref:Mitochondrial carrier protein n=1 Tax=Tegillarca granosa TaxID=220873 RepID=A0ABQ9G0A7_TEGGR|nr:hypothetical protein KUTeg_000322 [Tegillarca granosa]